jgi:hypothetical protein
MPADAGSKERKAMANGTGYSLIFQNNSINLGSACVYQQPPNLGTQDVMSLAWFAQEAAPTTKIRFSWQVDYSFVWAETGPLVPGVMFSASQTLPANPGGINNQVTLTDTQGALNFVNQTAGPQLGNLYIEQDGTIPENTASVGIAMSGAGTFAVAAEPNIQAVFTPTPNYFITFGQYTQGEVMSIETITSAAQIVFPANVFSMTAILNQDNTWTVRQTSQVNSSLARRRKSNPRAVWGTL